MDDDLLERMRDGDEAALEALYDRYGRIAPGASGRLYLAEDGRSGVLAVSGLPRLQPGRAYQFWFATADKSRRDSAGVFQVDAGGQALVSVKVPGGLEQYAEIWVTQEPADGSAVPTAPHYLEGPL
ncbi:MAG: anti-sigma factor domain-containing protein [Dehalococcoidia bacterium]